MIGSHGVSEPSMIVAHGRPGADTDEILAQLDSTIGDMSVEYLDQRTNRWYPSEEAATIRAIAVRVTLLPFENDTLQALLRLPFIFSMVDPNDRPQAVRR